MTLKDWVDIASPVCTTIGILVAILYNTRNLRQNSRIMRANWIFNTTMEFHKDDKLRNTFDAIQYENFRFVSEMPSKGGDLSTAKEMDLVYFLDFLNGICAAIEQRLVSISYVRKSTLGYAIEVATKDKYVRSYLDHVAKYDTTRMSRLISFGFLRDNRSFGHLRHVGDQITYKDSTSRRR